MYHKGGCLLALIFAEFDKGHHYSELRNKSKFKKLSRGTFPIYYYQWKREGGAHKLEVIQSVKQLLRKKIDNGVSEEEKETIPHIVKYLESRPYHWFSDKTPALALNSAIDTVTDYPRCLW